MTARSPHEFDPFRVDVLPERDVVRVRPVGELDFATTCELDAPLRELLDTGFRRVLLDLSELTFIDSTGVRLITAFDALVREDGVELDMVQGPPEVQRVFELCGLLDYLPFRRPPRSSP